MMRKIRKAFQKNFKIILELIILAKENKKWWLIPIIVILIFLALLVSFTGNQALLPSIYALF